MCGLLQSQFHGLKEQRSVRNEIGLIVDCVNIPERHNLLLYKALKAKIQKKLC